MIRSWTLATVLVAAAAVHAEDTRPGPLPGARAVGETPAPSGPVSAEYDPWQGVNRKIFSFNNTVDEWALEPVAKGWDCVTPKPVQHGIPPLILSMMPLGRRRDEVIEGEDDSKDVEIAAEEAEEAALEAE